MNKRYEQLLKTTSRIANEVEFRKRLSEDDAAILIRNQAILIGMVYEIAEKLGVDLS